MQFHAAHKDGRLTDVLRNASVYKDTRGNVLGMFVAARLALAALAPGHSREPCCSGRSRLPRLRSRAGSTSTGNNRAADADQRHDGLAPGGSADQHGCGLRAEPREYPPRT